MTTTSVLIYMFLIREPVYIDGLVQDYSISIAKALEIPQTWTKPLIYLDHCSYDIHVVIVYILI